MKMYSISEEELVNFLSYKILIDYQESGWETFALYLLRDTEYTPKHDFIQALCETEEEKTDPIATGVYTDITIYDLARYLVKINYQEREKR